MKIAMIGTRGIPAKYGGFETAVEEIGSRLAGSGHEIIVYCRGADRSPYYRGMRRVRVPHLRSKAMETLSHAALSVLHTLTQRPDAVIIFNAANATLLPLLRWSGTRAAVHVDGLEWKREKWRGLGSKFYKRSERLAVRWATELIADAKGIQDYYREEYRKDTVFIPYGAPILSSPKISRLQELGLAANSYHLVVARLEPENNVDLILEGYSKSTAQKQMVVVGSVPYASDHESRVRELAARDRRVRMLGGVWDQDLLDALYAGSLSYYHGHSVGGTNPSLLRAMGASAPVIAYDVVFNREVLGTTGQYFSNADQLSKLAATAEHSVATNRTIGLANQQRAAEHYRWDEVARSYEDLCYRLAGPRRQVSSDGTGNGSHLKT